MSKLYNLNPTRQYITAIYTIFIIIKQSLPEKLIYINIIIISCGRLITLIVRRWKCNIDLIILWHLSSIAKKYFSEIKYKVPFSVVRYKQDLYEIYPIKY